MVISFLTKKEIVRIKNYAIVAGLFLLASEE